jgi:hypothetical protein
VTGVADGGIGVSNCRSNFESSGLAQIVRASGCAASLQSKLGPIRAVVVVLATVEADAGGGGPAGAATDAVYARR